MTGLGRARLLVAALVVLAGGAVLAQKVVRTPDVEVRFLDRIVEQQSDGQTWLTLRFVAPEIGQGAGHVGYEQVSTELDRLCDIEGLPAAKEVGDVDQVLITLMDRIVERGVMDPDATIFIGAYLPTDGGCVWQ